MLITLPEWTDPTPPPLAKSKQAWKYVAFTCGTVNFWIVLSDEDGSGEPDATRAPEGWLVAGPKALRDAASDFEPGTIAVYVLDRVGTQRARLSRVTGLWREVGAPDDASCFWYANDNGELKPCASSQLLPRARLELEVRLAPEPQAGAAGA